VSSGSADVLCTPSNATLERRKTVSFSIPVFAGGIRAVVRTDAPQRCATCCERQPSTRTCGAARRAEPAGKDALRHRRGHELREMAGRQGSTFKLNTATVSVPDSPSGIRFLMERKIDVFLAERDVVLAAMDDATSQKVVILKRQLTHEPLALALPRGDDDFRLLVDGALASAYSSPQFAAMYSKYFRARWTTARASSSAGSSRRPDLTTEESR
jgi:ABC-type amino acid transport substrate-binding protein